MKNLDKDSKKAVAFSLKLSTIERIDAESLYHYRGNRSKWLEQTLHAIFVAKDGKRNTE